MASRTLKLPGTYELALSRSQRLVAAIGRQVVIADLATRSRVVTLKPIKHPSHGAFSCSERLLALKATSGEMVILSIPEGEVLAHRPARIDEGAEIFFSDCDKYLIDGSWSGSIRIWDVSSLRVVVEHKHPGEMIESVSCDSQRANWLFAHAPKTRARQNFPDRPYFTLWRWPLESPGFRLESGFDIVYSASLSPCGEYIAAVGHDRSVSRTELRVLNREGTVLAASGITVGGTASRTRWSPDGKLLAAVARAGLCVYAIPDLVTLRQFDAEYLSDVGFIESGVSLLIGTWKRGYIVPLELGNANCVLN